MRKVETIGIVGFGLMGREITRLCAQHGFKVIARDVDEKILQNGLEEIKSGRWGLSGAVAKGKLTREEAEAVINRIAVTTNTDEVCHQADYVIEAAPEDLELKKQIFKELSSKAGEDVVLASNTSTLPITLISAAAENPERVITTHFSQPVAVMRILEICLGRLTSEETLETTKELAAKLDRIISISKDMGTGVPTARLSMALLTEAFNLLEEGIATPKDIDICARYSYGHPMGPMEMRDQVVGWELVGKVRDEMLRLTGDERWKNPALLKQMLALGYKGNPKKWGGKGGIYELFGQKRIGEE